MRETNPTQPKGWTPNQTTAKRTRLISAGCIKHTEEEKSPHSCVLGCHRQFTIGYSCYLFDLPLREWDPYLEMVFWGNFTNGAACRKDWKKGKNWREMGELKLEITGFIKVSIRTVWMVLQENYSEPVRVNKKLKFSPGHPPPALLLFIHTSVSQWNGLIIANNFIT